MFLSGLLRMRSDDSPLNTLFIPCLYRIFLYRIFYTEFFIHNFFIYFFMIIFLNLFKRYSYFVRSKSIYNPCQPHCLNKEAGSSQLQRTLHDLSSPPKKPWNILKILQIPENRTKIVHKPCSMEARRSPTFT